MTVTRYSYDVDLKNLNNPHTLAVLAVRPGSRVLDLGAADGSVARALVRRGCTVWAIERDAAAAGAARAVCARVIEADLDSDDAWRPLENERFDAVLALDVLEHLTAPEAALRRATAHLAPDGIAVISLPNITHGAVRLMLLEGRFQYADKGLLDRTHLRFFDRAGAERLLRDANLTITDRLKVTLPVDATEIAVDPAATPEAVLRRIASDPDASTYQFVFVARPAPAVADTADGGLAERLSCELEALRARFSEVETYARHLEGVHAREAETETRLRDALHDAETALAQARRESGEAQAASDVRLGALDRQLKGLAGLAAELEGTQAELTGVRAELAGVQAELAGVQAELTRRMDDLQQKHLELRHSRADIAVKQAFIDTLREELRGAEARAAAAGRLQLEVQALRAYSQSAGFRLVERVLTVLRSVPFVFVPVRALVRAIAGRRPPAS